jgi:hypothetical protein
MSRSTWTEEEKQILIDNAENMTTKELQRKFFPDRTIKSVNRKVEKLRDLGLIGHRSRDAVKRALYGRGR